MFGKCSLNFPIKALLILYHSYSVPVSRLPELVYETKKDLLKSNLRSTIVGHVGDGNFHALILFDKDREMDAVSSAVHRLVHRAIALDGTCMYPHISNKIFTFIF
jgi:FAD/FMN-containing dehydrogenase